MDINTKSCSKSELKRQHFNIKKSRRDGLCLRIHHTSPTQKLRPQNVVRFHHSTFNSPGSQLAVSNHSGELFAIDFQLEKFWYLCSVVGITALKFHERDTLFVGTRNGEIEIIDMTSEARVGELIGHCEPVVDFGFSDGHCLSWSRTEAIVWDVEKRKNVGMLQANSCVGIKQATFMPLSNDLFICFEDDTMQIFDRSSLQPMAQFTDKSKVAIKCVTFTENGKALITSGHSNSLTVYLTSTLATHQIITLPTTIRSVRKIKFISRPCDNGANKILAVLSAQGTLYFVNIENEQIIQEITVETEILRFSACPCGKRVACIMSSCDVQIFDLVYLLNKTVKSMPSVSRSVRSKKSEVYRKKLKEILDVDKLKGILKEYGEYPELYRKVIWTSMLHLPSDKSQYEAIIKKRYENSFSDLEKKYPLVNSQDLRNMKRTLNSLVSWCPFFSEIEFLPIFIYPFIRVFKNDPVLTFEALMTIIMNYCQYWFEYYPLPPLNILGMIENLLIEHDPLLMTYFSEKRVISKTYALPLLQSAFSEVLTSDEWLILWDHIISNEPDFYLYSVVAYNITNRATLMSLKSYEEFMQFFTTQSSIDLKKFINKIYNLSSITSSQNNLKQYIDLFKKVENGIYYKFTGYPKAYTELSELNVLKKERLNLVDSEKELMRKQSEEIERLRDVQKENVELSRLSDLQLLYQKRIIEEHAEIMKQREKLDMLNSQITRSNSASIKSTVSYVDSLQKTDTSTKDSSSSSCVRPDFNQRTIKSRPNTSGKSKNGDISSKGQKKFKEKLIHSYIDLLKHKIKIEQIVERNDGKSREKLRETYSSLCQRLDQAKVALIDPKYLKQLTVKTGLETIDVLIERVQAELVQPGKDGKLKVQMLMKETREVSDEINQLIELFVGT